MRRAGRLSWGLVVLGALSAARAAGLPEVAPGWARLGEDRQPAERVEACQQLARVGGAEAVPGLRRFLGDPVIGLQARHALEVIPDPAAGAALRAAVMETTGEVRLGVVASLGRRGEVAAVPALIRLLRGTAGSIDPPSRELAAACAFALGAIPDAGAVEALREAWNGVARAEVADALLRQAHARLDSGQTEAAAADFAWLRSRVRDAGGRVAAERGLLRAAAGSDDHTRWLEALVSADPERRAAAAGLNGEWPRMEAAALADRMRQLRPEEQAARVTEWARGDPPPPAGLLRELAESPHAGLRWVALAALGRSGDATDIERLLARAAGAGAEAEAARLALTEIRDPRADEALAGFSRGAEQAIRREALRALGQRGGAVAAAALGRAARDPVESIRNTAWRGLSASGGDADVAALVRWVADPRGPAEGAAAARVLVAILERLAPESVPAELAAAWSAGSVAERASLAPVIAALPLAPVRVWLREAVGAADPRLREAARRALAGSGDPGLLEDQLALALGGEEEDLREAATRAGLRNAATAAGRGRRSWFLGILARAPLTLPQKRSLLAELGRGSSADDLDLAERFLADAECWSEAVAAVVGLAPRLPDAAVASAALELVLRSGLDAEQERAAEAARRGLRPRP